MNYMGKCQNSCIFIFFKIYDKLLIFVNFRIKGPLEVVYHVHSQPKVRFDHNFHFKDVKNIHFE